MKVVNTYEKISGQEKRFTWIESTDNWFNWTVSIDGTNEELSQIKYVTYILHKSFPNRRIISTDASTNFSRTQRGWGEFVLRAEATMKNGEVKVANKWLNLGFGNIDKINEYPGDFSSTQI